MEKFDTIIIGGGPAGLIAAIRAASLGQNVAVLEKNSSVGEKLLISGRGRCNFTNAEEDINIFISKYGENGKFLYSAFSKFGPIVMELSSHVPDWQGDLQFSLDLKPTLEYGILIARIKREIKKFSGRKRFAGLVRSLVPEKMTRLILELADIPHDKPIEYISDDEIFEFVKLLKDIRMSINGLWSFNNAVVTRGGVSLKEIEPSTMRSKLCENLYFAGEILDLNGPSGGFNLQICWSTGYVAGSMN